MEFNAWIRFYRQPSIDLPVTKSLTETLDLIATAIKNKTFDPQLITEITIFPHEED